MLKKNKNRGAGLVTVVAVLAVSSILLSGSIWLSFNHYKNVMTNKTNDDAYAELDLCAELICMSLSGHYNLDEILTQYYSSSRIVEWEDSNTGKKGKNIKLDGYDLYIFPKNGELSNGVEIQYHSGAEITIREYGFTLVESKYQITEVGS